MLVFKKNIYEPSATPHPENMVNQDLDPYNFIFHSLMTDREIFFGLNQLPDSEGLARFKTLFPHASQFGNLSLLNNFSRSLFEGLIDRSLWHTLNAYHLTYLFDSLHGTYEDYSYSEPQQRLGIFPELNGSAIDFDAFLDNYFFGTAFLMDPDRFNNMDPEEKKSLKLTDSCLFGVINQLAPAEEESRLETTTETPYLDK
ncbi:MAG: hypothetical protein HOK41_02535 [Nitrospina sp.]|jgi:hypothetical protein|nr:hypothetical protein [Nitrospina sp.]MBT6718380.1 hypothetical protein [Nitrospina sp.]